MGDHKLKPFFCFVFFFFLYSTGVVPWPIRKISIPNWCKFLLRYVSIVDLGLIKQQMNFMGLDNHPKVIGDRFRGEHMQYAPPLFYCRDTASDFVWVPQAKRMRQIMRTDFENYNFSALLWGHIPLKHPIPTDTKVLSVLNFGTPSFKNPKSALAIGVLMANMMGWLKFNLSISDNVMS